MPRPVAHLANLDLNLLVALRKRSVTRPATAPFPERGRACRNRNSASSWDPADGRGVRLSLTDAGRVVQRRIGRRHARGVARAMTAGLTAAELAQLETICRKLAAAPMAATDTSEVLIHERPQ